MTDWNWALHGLLDAHTHNKPHPHSQGHREPLCEHWEFTSYFLGFSLHILYEMGFSLHILYEMERRSLS